LAFLVFADRDGSSVLLSGSVALYFLITLRRGFTHLALVVWPVGVRLLLCTTAYHRRGLLAGLGASVRPPLCYGSPPGSVPCRLRVHSFGLLRSADQCAPRTTGRAGRPVRCPRTRRLSAGAPQLPPNWWPPRPHRGHHMRPLTCRPDPISDALWRTARHLASAPLSRRSPAACQHVPAIPLFPPARLEAIARLPRWPPTTQPR